MPYQTERRLYISVVSAITGLMRRMTILYIKNRRQQEKNVRALTDGILSEVQVLHDEYPL